MGFSIGEHSYKYDFHKSKEGSNQGVREDMRDRDSFRLSKMNIFLIVNAASLTIFGLVSVNVLNRLVYTIQEVILYFIIMNLLYYRVLVNIKWVG